MCTNTIGTAPAQNLSRHYYALLLLRNTDISRTGNADNGDISQHRYKKVRSPFRVQQYCLHKQRISASTQNVVPYLKSSDEFGRFCNNL